MDKDRVKVLFHAYTGYQLGSGHLMRCLALSKKMKQRRGAQIYFATNYDGSLFARQEFITEIMPDDAPPQQLKAIVGKIKPDIIVYDIPNVTEEYVGGTRLARSLAVVFDYFNRTERLKSADMVFNFHKVGGISNFIEGAFFEGIEYAILRDEFYQQIQAEKSRKGHFDILLTFGNSDPFGITRKVLDLLINNDGAPVVFHVMLGENIKDRQYIYSLSERTGRIKCYDNVSVAELMSKMDLVFVPGGVTLYEALQMKLPSIIVCAHHFAFELAEYLSQNGLAVNAGYYNTIDKKLLTDTLNATLVPAKLDMLRTNMMKININGAEMITDIVFDAIKPKQSLKR